MNTSHITPLPYTTAPWYTREVNSKPSSDARMYLTAYGGETTRAWNTIDPKSFERAAAVLLDAYTQGSRVFTCGNGGSASIANHFECDHVKGIRTGTALAPRVTSLSANVELITAIANDIGYVKVFSYQLESQASPGDVLVAVSSSGDSDNIVFALRRAREIGMRAIALTGFDGGAARGLAEVSIHVDCDHYGVIEDVHQSVMHALAQCIRQAEARP
jgi:phosphoheptose isomerase